MPEGRQSPPPERQSGAQQQSPPGSGQGTDNASNKDQVNKDQLENLSSNPKAPIDVDAKFAKNTKQCMPYTQSLLKSMSTC